MQDEKRVQQRAYELWEKAGRPDGQHNVHWNEALREIEAEDSKPRRSEDPDDNATPTPTPLAQ